jgi:peptidoglycan/xylan/chitin deacetylase (PgdA/CDA1 family)
MKPYRIRICLIPAVILFCTGLLSACLPGKTTQAVVTPPTDAFTVTSTPRPTGMQTPEAVPSVPVQKTAPMADSLPPALTPVNQEIVTARDGKALVPILLYHHVNDTGSSRYIIPTNTFRDQMEELHRLGYQTISISRLAEVLRHGGAIPQKTVVITFDDGYLDTFTTAAPIMKEYGFTGVAYIITSTFQKGKTYGYMQASELKSLLADGWEIGSHSVTHTDLNKTRLGVGNEMEQSKKDLENLLGVVVRSFSYPYGIANPDFKKLAEAKGYDSAVGLDILVTQTRQRLYFLSRREVERSLTLPEFRDLLVPGAVEQAAYPVATETPSPGNR